jgi:hypothetical protein
MHDSNSSTSSPTLVDPGAIRERRREEFHSFVRKVVWAIAAGLCFIPFVWPVQ